MVTYANAMGKQLRAHQPASVPTNVATPAKPQAALIPQYIPGEDITTIESDGIRLEIGRSSASVRSVELKKFHNISTGTPLRFGNGSPTLSTIISHDNSTWIEESRSNHAISFRKAITQDLDAKLAISIGNHEQTYSLNAELQNRSAANAETPISLVSSWHRGDSASGRSNLLEAVLNTKKQHGWERQYLSYRYVGANPQYVPRGTTMMTLSERFFCQAVKPSDTHNSSTILPSQQDLASASLDSLISVPAHGTASYSAEVYVGPRDFFILRQAGFEQAFPIGFLGKIGLILVLFLKGIASVVRNYGAAIVLLSAIVTTAFSPFTIISFRSMKKMQELQPKIEQLKKKYEKDPSKMNQETMALFREHKVSPLSGCLPMVIQMPIFFALWSAISHVIEFRGERFLWIKDLSLPDRLAKLPLGFDLNLLPILMAIAMYAQTKLTQQKTATAGTLSMLSGPIMPIMFGVMFYSVPSSLVLYWLTNTAISVISYRLIK